jgi:EamA-like transporter family.
MAYVFMAASILLTGVSQTLLKIGANGQPSGLGTYLNPASLAGYALFLVVTVCSVLALRDMELKSFYAMASLNFLVIMILSWLVLGERLTKNKVAAVTIIIAGIIVFNVW